MNKKLLLLIVLVPAAILFWGYAMLFGPQFSYVDEQPELPSPIEAPTEEIAADEPEPTPIPEGTEPKVLGEYSVTEVTDGDTILVSDGTEFISVRVIGIDAPETVYAPGGPECFNTDATLEADRLLAGQTVTLSSDPTQDLFDQYNRLLAYITLPDGRDFGEVMVEGGYAEEYTYRGRAYINQAAYKAAAEAAENKGLGVWGCE